MGEVVVVGGGTVVMTVYGMVTVVNVGEIVIGIETAIEIVTVWIENVRGNVTATTSIGVVVAITSTATTTEMGIIGLIGVGAARIGAIC